MEHNKLKAYQAMQVSTATPEGLVLLAYDGLVKFLNIARVKITEKDVEGANENLKRAQAIVAELMAALRTDCWEGSAALFRLYEYLIHLFVEANLRKDVQYIHQALEIVLPLRESWHEAFKQYRKEKGIRSSSINGKQALP